MDKEQMLARDELAKEFRTDGFAQIVSAAISFVRFMSKQKPHYVPAMFHVEADETVVFSIAELKREPEEKPVQPSKDATNAANALLAALRAGGPYPK